MPAVHKCDSAAYACHWLAVMICLELVSQICMENTAYSVLGVTAEEI